MNLTLHGFDDSLGGLRKISETLFSCYRDLKFPALSHSCSPDAVMTLILPFEAGKLPGHPRIPNIVGLSQTVWKGFVIVINLLGLWKISWLWRDASYLVFFGTLRVGGRRITQQRPDYTHKNQFACLLVALPWTVNIKIHFFFFFFYIVFSHIQNPNNSGRGPGVRFIWHSLVGRTLGVSKSVRH